MNVKQLDDALYDLKKQFGVKFQLFDITGVQSNIETGYKNVDTKVSPVCGFSLPKKMTREFLQSFSRGEGSQFNYGGLDDISVIVIIVRKKDLPKSFDTNLRYEVGYKGKRYNIVEINEFIDGLVYAFNFKHVEGQIPYSQIDRQSSDPVRFQELGGTTA